MQKRWIVVLIACVLCQVVIAQTINYDAYLFGNKVGTTTVTKTKEKDGGIRYTLESHITAKVLWITRENYVHLDTRYSKDGKLIQSTYDETNNGKKNRWALVRLEGKVYQVESNNGKRSFTDAPSFSVGSFYFDKYNTPATSISMTMTS
jgi:hypothetical protein